MITDVRSAWTSASRWLVVVAILGVPCPNAAYAEIIIDMVTVGDPGNAPSSGGYGAVPYAFQIGKYEVTALQYTAFLNAVAKTDVFGLYHPGMSGAGGSYHAHCGIQREGSDGDFSYTVSSGAEDLPVNHINFWRAARFVNWLHNGQPSGPQSASTTEDGAYTLDGYNGDDGRSIGRNDGAKYWIPSEDEWYKAGYYKGGNTDAGYWKYATKSDTAPGKELLDGGNNANYGDGRWPCLPPRTPIGPPHFVAPVGTFVNSASPYGTFDQNGNVAEWLDTVVQSPTAPAGVSRSLQGGGWIAPPESLPFPDSTSYNPNGPAHTSSDFGFRVASSVVPEPSTLVLLGLGAIGVLLHTWRRRRA